jgi:hypothetical protein
LSPSSLPSFGLLVAEEGRKEGRKRATQKRGRRGQVNRSEAFEGALKPLDDKKEGRQLSGMASEILARLTAHTLWSRWALEATYLSGLL